MPIVNGQYQAPTWVNGQAPAINASEMQAISDTLANYGTGKLNVVGKGANLLDNWYFGNIQNNARLYPINQRGAQTSSGAGYWIDRWSVSSASLVGSYTSKGIRLTNNGSGIYGIVQQVEDFYDLAGKALTVSAVVRTVSGSGGVTLAYSDTSASVSGSSTTFTNSSYQVVSYTFTPSDTSDRLWIWLRASANTVVEIASAKLEIGSIQTLAENSGGGVTLLDAPPNYQQELAKCQRYQVMIPAGNAVGNFRGTGSSTSCLIEMPLPVTPRGAGTISTAISVIGVIGGNSVNATIAANTAVTAYPNGVRIPATAASTVNAGTAGICYFGAACLLDFNP